MNLVRRTHYEQLSRAEAARVDAACDRFESAWKAIGADAEAPSIRTYCADLPEPERTVLAWELMAVDHIYRERRGETPRADVYRGLCAEYDEQLIQSDSTRPRGPENRRVDVGIGTKLPGLQIAQVLGSGGMGVVYKAWQPALGRYVAVKMLRGADGQMERFEREARAVAKLQHPNLVQIYAIGETPADGGLGKVPYLVLEYVRGGSLADFLKGAPQSPRAASQLVENLARAIAYVHNQGIIHRDLKPANVLLQAHGAQPVDLDAPKITDFGLAKLAAGSDLTRTGDTLGTPSYMAPEQIDTTGATVSPATDVYGLGAILYEMLTGRPPFKAETPLVTVLQVQRDEPVSLRRLQPTVPRDLETICLMCLRKEPHHRYATALALADDLVRFREGRPIQARPLGVWRRAGKWVWRQPATAASLAAVVVVTVLGFGGILWQLGQKERALEKVQTTLYYHSVSLAHHEWGAGNLERADKLLEACQANRHQWEWRYVHRLCHAELFTCGGYSAPVTSVAFSPNGRLLAAASGLWAGTTPGEVKILDATSAHVLFSLGGHMGSVWGVAFSPDGRRLASSGGEWGRAKPGELKIWDTATGAEIRTIRGHWGSVFGLAFSPDGGTLASAGADGTVQIWDALTGERLNTIDGPDGHTDNVFSVEFSPDGRTLASGSRDGSARIWDATSGRMLHRLLGHGDIRHLAFSADGRRLATASYTQAVQVWDTIRGELLFTHHVHTSPVLNVAFSPDGRQLASTDGEGLVKIYDALRAGQVRTVRGHTGPVTSVAFSPAGERLVTGGRDALVKVWDITTDQEFHTLSDHVTRVVFLAFSPDSQRLATAGRDGRGGKEVVLRKVATGQIQRTFTGHTDWVTGLTYCPDGKHVASSSRDKTVKVWDAATGQVVHEIIDPTGEVTGVSFSPDGHRLAYASNDKTVKIWDVTGERVMHTLSGHTEVITGVAYSPDGKQLASASMDRTVKIWNAETGQEVCTLRGHADIVTALAISPNGRHLATSSADKTVVLWEMSTRSATHRLEGHTRGVLGLAFSPDGQRLASASMDWSVKVWDVITGQAALTLHGRMGEVYSVAFSPDGRYLATGSEDSTRVRLWDGSAPAQGGTEVPASRLHAWHRREADVSEGARNWLAAVFHLDRLIAEEPEQPDYYARRSKAFAQLGQWDKAVADCARLVELQPRDVSAWYRYAVAHLGLDDRAGHRNVCASMHNRFGQTNEAGEASFALYACLPIADAANDTGNLLRLAEMAVAAFPGNERVLGAVLYRAGRPAEAVQQFREAEQHRPLRAWDHLFLAMANHQLGQHELARDWLAKAMAWIDKADAAEEDHARSKGPIWYPWQERIEVRCLRQEAEAFLGGKK